MNSNNTLKIGIQSKGKLALASQEYLYSLGLRFRPAGKNDLVLPCLNCGVEIMLLRDDDIPRLVDISAIDLGIVGENVVYEKNFGVEIIKNLGFGACSLVIAVPQNSKIKNIKDLNGEKIATTYPKLLNDFLEKNRIAAEIIEIKGSAEIIPRLKVANAICDLTQTGKTLKANNLVQIATVLESQAVLIQGQNVPLSTIKKINLIFNNNLVSI